MIFKVSFDYLVDGVSNYICLEDCYNICLYSNSFGFQREIDGQLRTYKLESISNLLIEQI